MYFEDRFNQAILFFVEICSFSIFNSQTFVWNDIFGRLLNTFNHILYSFKIIRVPTWVPGYLLLTSSKIHTYIFMYYVYHIPSQGTVWFVQNKWAVTAYSEWIAHLAECSGCVKWLHNKINNKTVPLFSREFIDKIFSFFFC